MIVSVLATQSKIAFHLLLGGYDVETSTVHVNRAHVLGIRGFQG